MANNSNKKQSNSTGKRGSVVSTGNIINLLACIAICVSVVVYVVNLIVNAVDGSLGTVGTVLTTIKDICVVIALGFPTLMYARGKKQWVKLIIYVLLSVFLVLAILGNVLI